MIEKQVIIDKLEAEGISTAIGEVLKFDNEDELNSFTQTYKANLPQPKEPDLNSLTKEQLDEIAKENKAFQGWADSIRTKAVNNTKAKLVEKSESPKKMEEKEEKKPDVPNEFMDLLKELKDEMDTLKAQKEEVNFESAIKSEFGEGLDNYGLRTIKALCGNDTSKIKEEVEAYKKLIKPESYMPGKGNKATSAQEISKDIQAWKSKRKK